MTQGLGRRINAVIRLDPSANAIEFHNRWHSWREVAEIMQSIEAIISAASLGEGETIGILLRNRPASFAAALQVIASQRCVVTLNPFQNPEKIGSDISALRVPVLIADRQDWEIPEVRAAAQACGTLGIAIGSEPILNAGIVPGFEQVGAGEHHPPQPGTCILMLTSGTTGPAKRIPLPFRSFENSLLNTAHYEQGGNPDGELKLKTTVSILSTPLVHIGGLWHGVASIVSGRPFSLLEKFNVSELRQQLLRHRPKLIALPPTALRMILDADVPREDLSSLLAIRTGSSPLEPALIERFEDQYGVPLLDSYGATEFAGAVAGWTLPDYKKFGKSKRGSVGRVQPGSELRVIDAETGAVLPAGTVGLLEVKTQQVKSGGWLRTTDLAEIDSDGFVFIRGRADDAIIRGGFKVLPGDVEAALREHPAVADACVVGIADERLGAVPMAAVELHDSNSPVSGDELQAFARKHLTSYQVPVKVLIVEALPRTPSLKISKHEVRKLFEPK